MDLIFLHIGSIFGHFVGPIRDVVSVLSAPSAADKLCAARVQNMQKMW
jgi:hypothetical protein